MANLKKWTDTAEGDLKGAFAEMEKLRKSYAPQWKRFFKRVGLAFLVAMIGAGINASVYPHPAFMMLFGAAMAYFFFGIIFKLVYGSVQWTKYQEAWAKKISLPLLKLEDSGAKFENPPTQPCQAEVAGLFRDNEHFRDRYAFRLKVAGADVDVRPGETQRGGGGKQGAHGMPATLVIIPTKKEWEGAFNARRKHLGDKLADGVLGAGNFRSGRREGPGVHDQYQEHTTVGDAELDQNYVCFKSKESPDPKLPAAVKDFLKSAVKDEKGLGLALIANEADLLVVGDPWFMPLKEAFVKATDPAAEAERLYKQWELLEKAVKAISK